MSVRPALPVLALVALAAAPVSGQTPTDAALADAIRQRIEAARAGAWVSPAGEPILARGALPVFYERRGFSPAWLGAGAEASAEARALVAELERAEEEGLRPVDYHLPELAALLAAPRTFRSVDRRADLELLLTDAFLVFGSHLLQGRVNPESLEPEWTARRRDADLAAVLEDALTGGADVPAALERLRPRSPRYARLREALGRLRGIVGRGGWEAVPTGEPLALESEGARVAALARRLQASGDLGAWPGPGEVAAAFDSALHRAVVRFQSRHGLVADGVVGAATLAALAVPAADRVRQVEANLERWRWLPEELGERHLEVNIAGFSVDVVERGERVMRLRAIVGRDYTQTPSFSAEMRYLVFSPYWHVPPGIAAREEFPAIRRDPGRLVTEGFTVIDRATGRVVDPDSIEWDARSAGELARIYRLRQEPGPRNALGKVKFMFPNPFDVYLHDTPGRALFERTARAFSHGCIRVERPLELAEHLLREQGWTAPAIRAAAEQGRETTVTLRRPVPVHLLYWTAWIDPEDGTLQLREDLYGRDLRVVDALFEPPPGP